MQAKNKFILKVIIFTTCFFCLAECAAFDWPQLPENAAIFFAQKRGNSFSRSIVFTHPAEVKAADTGILLINLKIGIADMGWFESPLGNALILAHSNDMRTVYGNLQTVQEIAGGRTTAVGEIIGISGTSLCQKDAGSLEFQVIDTKMKKVLNPTILMNTSLPAPKYVIRSLIAVGKGGEKINLSSGRSLPAGFYTLYMEENQYTMLHNTSTSLNGSIVEVVSYDALKEQAGRLCIQGKLAYPFAAVYLDEMIRLADIALSRGKNTLEVSIKDISGSEQTVRLVFSVF